MKKLSLLLALAIFGFGSATMVKAEEVPANLEASEEVGTEVETSEETTGEDSVIIGEEEVPAGDTVEEANAPE